MTGSNDVQMQLRLADLELELDAVQKRLHVMEKKVAEVIALGRDFWREHAAEMLVGSGVTSWHYDVRKENLLFADLSTCEVFDGYLAHRWVGRSGEIAATISINRALPLNFSATVTQFASPELEDSLRLEIDGELVPWTAKNGPIVLAELVPLPGRARLSFRLSVDRGLLQPNMNNSFAFSELRIWQVNDAKGVIGKQSAYNARPVGVA